MWGSRARGGLDGREGWLISAGCKGLQRLQGSRGCLGFHTEISPQCRAEWMGPSKFCLCPPGYEGEQRSGSSGPRRLIRPAVST